ncbi:MAG: hypothetical protein GC168_12510 [Candidatus Hydrogenedens sp.]|nr:hypothetical protein [Candidatus Hydrogenedens sp.]
MHALALYIAAAALAQVPLYGDIPKDVPTFVIRESDGSTSYGALYVDNDWYRSEAVSLGPAQRPTIVYDTPWNPGSKRVMKLPEFSIETPVLREGRLKRDWESAGYAPVSTPQGELYFPKSEIELAQRAAEMESALLSRDAAPESSGNAPAAVSQGTPAEPGFLQQWGLHLALGAAGLAATAGVFWRLVIKAE